MVFNRMWKNPVVNDIYLPRAGYPQRGSNMDFKIARYVNWSLFAFKLI